LLPGPLWLFKTQDTDDKVFGGVVTVALLPAIFAWVVRRHPATILLAVMGILAWVAFGMWVATIAAA
jgi:hypothetical protein